MKKLLILLLALLAIAAIAYFCVYKTHVPQIEKDISTRTQAALEGNGVEWAKAEVDGRNIILTGVAPTKELKDSAERIAHVNGVNFVNNKMTVLGEEEQVGMDGGGALGDGYSLTLSTDESGQLILDGVMSAEMRQQVLVEIQKKSKGANLVDNISIKDVDAPKNLPALSGFMADKISVLDNGSAATLAGNKLLVSGETPTPAAIDKLKEEIAKELPEGYKSELDISLAAPSDAGSGDKDAVADKAKEANKNNLTSMDKKDKKPSKKQSKAEAKQCQRQLTSILRKKKIYFNSSSAVIKKSSRKVLNQLAKVAKKCSTHKIRVHGHTDATGRNKLNQRLSRKRAQSVVNYLAKRGVNAKHLHAVGHGSSKPIASNKTPKGRARNRRIELTVED